MTDDPETPGSPLRPVKEYEEITIRELSVGFSGGTQDMTIYPEDKFEADELGNIRVEFVTLGGGEFVAYAGHTQWHSLKDRIQKREKGTLRPDPAAIVREFQEEEKRRKEEELRRFYNEVPAEG